MQGSMEEPQRFAPAPEEPISKPEPVDFSEALLSSEKLPSDLQDDVPAGSSQVLPCLSVQPQQNNQSQLLARQKSSPSHLYLS